MPSYRPPPPRPPSYGGGYPQRGSTILDLMMRQGQIQAEGSRRNAEIWGSTIHNIGQTLAGGIQQNALEGAEKNKIADMARRDAAWVGYVESGEWQSDPRQALSGSLRIWGPEKGPQMAQGLLAFQGLSDKGDEEDAKRLGITIGAAENLSDPVMQRWYPEMLRKGAPVLARKGIPVETLPQEWTPEAAPELRRNMRAIGMMLRGEMPAQREGFTLNPGDVRFGADGNEIARVAAEPKPETRGLDVQAAEAQARGDHATYARLLKVKKEMGQADDRPRVGDGGAADAQRARLVDAVIADPALWDELTAGDKGDIAADLSAKGFSGFGKPLTDGAIAKISGAKAAVASLRDLRDTLQKNEQYIGPIAGLAAMNPYSEANKAQADINLVLQRVGKALEDGVLRKEDEEKYKKILATLRDTPSTAIYKVDGVITTLERDMELFVEEQRAAGRRTSSPTDRPRPQQPPAAGPGGGAPVRVSSPADAMRLPPGTEFQTPDGRIMRVPIAR